MAQDRESLEESSLDQALAQSRQEFDPTDPDEGLMGGHPAQEEEDEDEDKIESPPPVAPVTPPATPPLVVDATAESRRLEAEQRMNLAIGEATALKAERDRLTQEIEALRRQATPPPAPTPKELPDVSSARAQLRLKLQEISAVDNKLADYWERLEESYVGMIDPLIQARASEVFQSLSPAQQQAMRQTLLQDPEFIGALKTALVPEVRSEVSVAQENTRIFQGVVDAAEAAGFHVGQGGEDADLFWDVAIAAVDKSMPQGTTEAKTARAVEIMRSLKGEPSAAAALEPPAATPPARPVRQPMGRQSAGPPASGGNEQPLDKPASLDDAIRATHGALRV